MHVIDYSLDTFYRMTQSMFSSLFPLVIVALLGYFALRSHYVSAQTIGDLSKITFSLLFPLFLFINIAQADLSGIVSYSVFLTFYAVVTSTFIITTLLAPRLFKMQSAGGAVFALGSTYSNTIIVGLPVLISVLSPSVAALVFLIISFHSAVLFGATSIFSSFATGNSFQLTRFCKGLLKNPLLIGIYSGLMVNMLGIDVPGFIASTLHLITQGALALALFILGANLYQYRLAGNYQQIISATIIKLIVLPLAVLLVARLGFQLSDEITLILVVLTACPTGVNAYIVACQQNSGQSLVAGTVVLSTLLSVVTIPLWIYILQTHLFS
ncbi:AEC family transporter [Pseudoalteromonas spongiae]|uniref:AEC family transporter n=1 Tax=Pseudoalteromonas spongiae TaxID=298657 RepID=UPI0012FE5CB7|nr:AEC family transporter [Pseudoalteromonas spongiae]